MMCIVLYYLCTFQTIFETHKLFIFINYEPVNVLQFTSDRMNCVDLTYLRQYKDMNI